MSKMNGSLLDPSLCAGTLCTLTKQHCGSSSAQAASTAFSDHLPTFSSSSSWHSFCNKCHVCLCLYASNPVISSRLRVYEPRNGSAATKKDSCRSLLPTDRNPHWLQIGMIWDNSGTNWQLQSCFSFVFCLFTPLCWAAFEDCQSLHEKRKFLSYSVFSKCNLFMLSSHIPYFSDSKYWDSREGYTDACPHRLGEGNVHKQTQTSNRIKVEMLVFLGLCDVTDCCLLGLAQLRCFVLFFQCRSDLKIRVWYLAWQLHSN